MTDPRWHPETVLLKARMRALAQISPGLATKAKRFILDMCDRRKLNTTTMTERQKMLVERLAWRYRRQMPVDLVPAVDPGPMPAREAKPKRVATRIRCAPDLGVLL